MWQAIQYNLANLANVNGRDARSTFWYYVLFIVICQFVAGMLVALPMLFEIGGAVVDVANNSASSAHGTAPSEAEIQAMMMGRMGGMVGQQVILGAIVNAAATALLAASLVRRVHDSGRSGLWALIPIVLELAAIAFNLSMMGQVEAMMELAGDPARIEEFMARQHEIARWGFVGSLGPAAGIVIGLLPSTEGANAYGEEPVRF